MIWTRFATLALAIVLLLTACSPARTERVIPSAEEAQSVEQSEATSTPYPTYTAVVIPTETPTPGPTATPLPSGNQAKFLYANTYPENKREFRPNENFNIAFGFENVGEVTWDPSYALVFVGGDQFTAVTAIPLGRYVEPGEKCEFNLGTFGSEDIRLHTTYWALITGPGEVVEGGSAYFSYTPY